MQLANPIQRRAVVPSKRRQPVAAASPEAAAEITAYIAIRDELFAEAEQLRTEAKLQSVTAANDFVLVCLRPARSPYQAQCLPEQDAVRERKRCEFIKGRIAQLRLMAAPASHLCGCHRGLHCVAA